jgi:ring-1,2-phenylacetyl-CoA epoxidase subunit PaaB
MSDTQWPRYEVFKKDNERKVHEAVGSVHAPDLEMALLAARNVFVRRPSAVSLWVVAAEAILSRTAEELAADPPVLSEVRGETETFLVFTKQSQRRSMTFVKHVGEVRADTAVSALARAYHDPAFEPEGVFVWWVVPSTAVLRSDDENIESMFAPAKDKTYRQQSAYGFISPRRKKP